MSNQQRESANLNASTSRAPMAQNMNLEQLSRYFHLPINDVAKELGVCATVLKKICRRNGIPRWPHRKIKSIDKRISTLEMTVPKSHDEEHRITQEINLLKEKKNFLMKNPVGAKQRRSKSVAAPGAGNQASYPFDDSDSSDERPQPASFFSLEPQAMVYPPPLSNQMMPAYHHQQVSVSSTYSTSPIPPQFAYHHAIVDQQLQPSQQIVSPSKAASQFKRVAPEATENPSKRPRTNPILHPEAYDVKLPSLLNLNREPQQSNPIYRTTSQESQEKLRPLKEPGSFYSSSMQNYPSNVQLSSSQGSLPVDDVALATHYLTSPLLPFLRHPSNTGSPSSTPQQSQPYPIRSVSQPQLWPHQAATSSSLSLSGSHSSFTSPASEEAEQLAAETISSLLPYSSLPSVASPQPMPKYSQNPHGPSPAASLSALGAKPSLFQILNPPMEKRQENYPHSAPPSSSPPMQHKPVQLL